MRRRDIATVSIEQYGADATGFVALLGMRCVDTIGNACRLSHPEAPAGSYCNVIYPSAHPAHERRLHELLGLARA
jgi:hypothetical protein